MAQSNAYFNSISPFRVSLHPLQIRLQALAQPRQLAALCLDGRLCAGHVGGQAAVRLQLALHRSKLCGGGRVPLALGVQLHLHDLRQAGRGMRSAFRVLAVYAN